MAKHEVGDRLIEDLGSRMGTYSAGRIAGMYESPAKKGTVYMLLVSDSGEFTVYAALESQHARPWVPRQVPPDVFRRMAETCLGGVDLPPEREAPKKKDPPVESVSQESLAAVAEPAAPAAGENPSVPEMVPGVHMWVSP